MKEFWNQRYNTDEFVYGREPNTFFAESLELLSHGKMLLPGEGEGRNAVFAAGKGWEVEAFDQSSIGAKKARTFAREKGVEINFQVKEVQAFHFKKNFYDSVGLIYFHAPPPVRKLLHQGVAESLKPGGMVILEAFHTSQLGNSSGGPQSLEMLFDREILLDEFSTLDIDFMEELEVNLEEGLFHGGAVKLIRFRGIKR